MLIAGWGRMPTMEGDIVAPLSPQEAQTLLRRDPAASFIPRGMGRSYGDSALAARAIGSTYLNLLLGFDSATGVVRCGAGVTLGALLDVFVPRGWFLPVTPGTRFVSVGGAIASDVHGKNHHLDGCFSAYVENLVLLLGNGDTLTCSPHEHAELFAATCGGMGLTGLILEAAIRLRPISSALMDQATYKTRDLEETLALFDTHHKEAYSVAWVDMLGASAGRALFSVGEHAGEGPLSTPSARSLTVPFDMPSGLLNRLSARAFNAGYYRFTRVGAARMRYDPFFYPLDRIHDWNRLYGKRGPVQYQFVIPKATGRMGMEAILKRVSDSRHTSFLAVLKLFGHGNDNPLSFPMEGYTLALDFKPEKGLFAWLEELDRMVLDLGGRIYLTKDARMSAATFRRGYPRWEEFQAVRERYAARGRFASAQSKRLGLD